MTDIDLKNNPKFPLDDSWDGMGKFRSMTSDLPWFSFYTLKVLLGWPRIVTELKAPTNGWNFSLVEDNYTGRWFMARPPPHYPHGLVQYCKADSHYFEKK